MSETSKRKSGLDALRFFACLGIVLLHYSNYSCPNGVWFGSFLLDPAETTSIINLNVMVEVFFFLSGFLIFPYSKKIQDGMRFRSFFLPRVIRILPMLTIGTILLEIVSYLLAKRGYSQEIGFTTPYLWGILSSCLGISYSGIFTSANINPASWYLDILLSCFVIYYVLIKLSIKTKIDERYYFFSMILLGAACYAHNFALPLLDQGCGRGYEAFFSGVLFSGIPAKKDKKNSQYLLSLTIIAIYAIYLLFFPELLTFGKTHLYNFFITPALITLFTSRIAEKLFSFKIWTLLGKASYSAYLLHVAILFSVFLLTNHLGVQIDYSHEVVFFFFAILVYIFSTITYYLIEKPLTEYLTKKIAKQS